MCSLVQQWMHTHVSVYVPSGSHLFGACLQEFRKIWLSGETTSMRVLGFFNGYTLMRQSMEVVISDVFSTVDLGSRGRCQVLFKPGNLDIISKGPCIWIRRFISEKSLSGHCGVVASRRDGRANSPWGW